VELELCVVVATRNRASRLSTLVDALARQNGPSSLEVVIVDDASTDGTWDELTRLAAVAPFPLHPIRGDRHLGPAGARNAGWRATSAPIVVFTDDDCLPQPGWLTALVAALDGADMAQGRTAPDPERVLAIGPFGHTVEVKAEIGFYETCNIAYRRSLLERLGGFDEHFRYRPRRGRRARPEAGAIFGEDSDLGWRAKKSGARSVFVADALVHHEVRSVDFRTYLRDLRRREGLVLAIRRHPEIRDHYPLGVFFSPAHPMALLTAAALAGLGRRPGSPARWALVMAASAGYTVACLRSRHWPPKRIGWATALPLALVADLAEVGVLAAASARYRTLFL
jgi:glycosyltransferase involved in cell wall biosynthesis